MEKDSDAAKHILLFFTPYILLIIVTYLTTAKHLQALMHAAFKRS